MLVTTLKGVLFNKFGNTTNMLPSNWVEVNFNFKIKKHREARDSSRTRIVVKMEGWGGTKKWPKPILSYWTDDLDAVKFVMENGDISNGEHFVFECAKII
jgi:hypothetical protein